MNFFGVTKKYDFAHGPIMNGMLMMALPLLGIAALNGIYNLIAQLFINRIGYMYGYVCLAAYSAGNTVINNFLAFAMALMVAATVVVARSCGKNDARRTSASVNTALLVSVIAGVIMAAIIFVFGRTITYNFYAYYAEAAFIVGRYVSFNALNVLFSTVFYALIGSMYGMGDSVRPLIIFAVKTLLGIVLNVAAMILGFAMNAIAIVNTVTALVGAVLALVCFLVGNGDAKLNFGAGFHGKSLAFILVLALTAGIQNLPFFGFTGLETSMFSMLGEDSIAAASVGTMISSIVRGVPAALIPVILAAVSQASGAGDARKAFKNAGASVAVAVLPALVITMVLLVIGPFAARLIYGINDYGVMEYLPLVVRTGVISAFFTSAMLAVTAAIRARGATVLATLSSCLVTLGVSAIIYNLVEYNGIVWISIGKMGIGFASLIPVAIVFVVVNLIAVATEKPGSRVPAPVNSAPVYNVPVQPARPQHNFDPITGKPINQPVQPVQPVQPARPQYNFDPITGRPLNQPAAPQMNFDPMTGEPLNTEEGAENK